MAKTVDAADAIEQSKEYMTNHIATSEKFVEGMIEFNAAMFKSGETLAKKAYENYIANVATGFDNVKALNKTSDVSEFYKVATSNTSAATERMAEQAKEYSELATKVLKDAGEAGRQAYTKSVSGTL